MNEILLCLQTDCQQQRLLEGINDIFHHNGHNFVNFNDFQKMVRENPNIQEKLKLNEQFQIIIEQKCEQIIDYFSNSIQIIKNQLYQQLKQLIQSLAADVKQVIELVNESQIDILRNRNEGLNKIIKLLHYNQVEQIDQIQTIEVLQKRVQELFEGLDNDQQEQIKSNIFQKSQLKQTAFRKIIRGDWILGIITKRKCLDLNRLLNDIRSQNDLTQLELDLRFLKNKNLSFRATDLKNLQELCKEISNHRNLQSLKLWLGQKVKELLNYYQGQLPLFSF